MHVGQLDRVDAGEPGLRDDQQPGRPGDRPDRGDRGPERRKRRVGGQRRRQRRFPWGRSRRRRCWPTTAAGGIGLPPAVRVYSAWTTYEYSHKQLVSTRVYYAMSPEAASARRRPITTRRIMGIMRWASRSGARRPPGRSPGTCLNAEGETMSTWVGTDDVDATATDPNGRRRPARLRVTTWWKSRPTSTTPTAT
jgi:hypothetical protein